MAFNLIQNEVDTDEMEETIKTQLDFRSASKSNW